jgi:hypothetical protein
VVKQYGWIAWGLVDATVDAIVDKVDECWGEVMAQMPDAAVVAAVRSWVVTVVVGLELCPFAGREVRRDSLRYAVSEAVDEEALLEDMRRELLLIGDNQDVESTLLIHPQVLGDFYDYNQFLGSCAQLLSRMKLTGVYQLASFHPRYQFAGTVPADAENFSNRSPFPMLHILREASVARAVAACPDVESVPERNIAKLRALGNAQMAAMLAACQPPAHGDPAG